jgi:hypothetical protein
MGAMPLRLPSMPILSLASIEEIQRIQQTATSGLLGCKLPGTSFLNKSKALEIMCASSVAEFDIRSNFYMTRPDFEREWGRAIVLMTLDSILGFPMEWTTVCPDFFPVLRENLS